MHLFPPQQQATEDLAAIQTSEQKKEAKNSKGPLICFLSLLIWLV
jgi:hypothetical protein